MTEQVRCDKHLFEDATGMCRTCRRPYCADCLVYTQGANRAPLCVPCALTAAGVRSTAAVPSQRGSGAINVAAKLVGGVAAAAGAAVFIVPHIH